MTQRCLRQKPRISYYEIEEPNLDEYIYCDKCADNVYEYCSIHGPLLVIPDDKVPARPNVPDYVPRAALTVPNVFLHIAPSSIPGAGLGVFSTLTLPSGVRFGPYVGARSDGVDSNYCWQIYDTNRKPVHCVDASDANRSNWMRYVNCSRHWSEQNLVAFQYRGGIYYRTNRIIPRFTELLVFYGSEFANELDIHIGQYNVPGYAIVYDNKRKHNEKHPTTQDTEPADTISNDFKTGSDETEIPTKKIHFEMTDGENDLPNNRSVYQNSNAVAITKKNQEKVKFAHDKGKDCPAPGNSSQLKDICYICDSCNEKFVKKSDLEHHLRLHDEKRAYSCEICTCRFTSSDSLRKHLGTHNQVKPYACHLCAGTFYTETKLKRHLRTHTGQKPYTSEIREAKFAEGSNLKRHSRTQTAEKRHTCEICKAKFAASSELKRHLRTHTGEKPYTCETCGAKFTQGSHLKIHLRTHTREKPYTCETCGAKFTSSSNLKSHLRTHTGEKPYTCETCGAKFTNSSNLKSHLRTHTGEKPYTCETCGAKFTNSSNLKSHLRTHTGEKPHTCKICEAKFAASSDLKRHLRTHTGEKPYTRETCGAKFAYPNSLKRHLKTHTGKKL